MNNLTAAAIAYFYILFLSWAGGVDFTERSANVFFSLSFASIAAAAAYGACWLSKYAPRSER